MSSSAYEDGCIAFTPYEEVTVVDPVGAAVSFFVFFIIGIIIAIIIYIFFGELIFSEAQEDEHCIWPLLRSKLGYKSVDYITLDNVTDSNWKSERKDEELGTSSYSKLRSESPRKDKRSRKKIRRNRIDPKEKAVVEEKSLISILQIDDTQLLHQPQNCMVDAVLQSNTEAGEVVLTEQDAQSTYEMDRRQRLAHIIALATLERLQSNNLLSQGRIDSASHKTLVTNIEAGALKMKTELEARRKIMKDEILNDPELAKTPELRDKKLEDLPSHDYKILNNLLKEEGQRFKDSLIGGGGLTEDEANAVMTEIANQLSNYESSIRDQQSKQLDALEARLANRRKLLSETKRSDESEFDEIAARLDSRHSLLTDPELGLADKQVKPNLQEYWDQLNAAQSAHEQNLEGQRRALAERLRNDRAQRRVELQKRHLNEQDELLKRLNKSTDTRKYLNDLHVMGLNHEAERNAMESEMDQQEVIEYLDLRRKAANDRSTQIDEIEHAFNEKLKLIIPPEKYDVEKIMGLHLRQLKDFKKAQKDSERQQKQEMEKKLEERRKQLAESRQRKIQETLAFQEHESSILQKTLGTQLEMPEECKKRILAENAANSATLANQMQLNKSRQEKMLEKRLAEKRANIAAVEQQKKKNAVRIKFTNQKDFDKQQAILDAQIAKEEAEFKALRKTEQEEFREKMARETQEALDLQEKNITELMGRLQVGQARRKNILNRQEDMLKELEEKLEKEVADRADKPGISISSLDQVLQRHTNNVQALADRQSQAREEQEYLIDEKLRRAREKKAGALKNTLDEEADATITTLESSGISISAQALMHSSLEAKQTKAMEELEREYQAELKTQRDEMLRELEASFEEDLHEQRRSFLAQLATLTDMNTKDIDSIVKETAIGLGADEKYTRSLVKSFRKEMEKVLPPDQRSPRKHKSNSKRNKENFDEEDFDNPTYSNSKSKSRKKSARRQPSRRTPTIEEEEEDFS